MAKLIPGKIRIEGVALYETGKVDIIKEKNIGSTLALQKKNCAIV
ncbi:putative SNF-family helicase [Streptococcus pneumoniae]|nr:putative SNF-family helicase [Streptococcus pneumoniae]